MIRFSINFDYYKEKEKEKDKDISTNHKYNKSIKNNDDKLENGWNTERLNYRFKLFENICLPSLINQEKRTNFYVLVIISDDLPQFYKNKLNQLLSKHKNFHLEIFDGTLSNTYLKKYYENLSNFDENKNLVATVRLDDDDALHPSFSRIIFNYLKKENLGKIISFPKGYFVNKVANEIVFRKVKKKLIAAGIVRISTLSDNKTIYCNRHRKFKKDGYYCVFDNFFPMYLVINHKWGDQGRIKKKLPGIAFTKNEEELDIVKKNYSYLDLNFFKNL